MLKTGNRGVCLSIYLKSSYYTACVVATDFLGRGHMLADLVAIVGSMDVVFGEVDR